MSLSVNVLISTDDHEVLARAVEAFTRAAIGIALEGAPVTVMIGPSEEDDDE